MSLYYLGNYRTEEQRAEMLRLENAGVCIFCPEHLTRDSGQVSILRTTHWTVTPNRYPYKGAREHLLLVPDEHVVDLVDLSSKAQRDFWTALGWVREHFTMTHYGVGIRNGDCQFTGGTIRHVHVHVIVGEVEDALHEPVRMKLSSLPRSR